MEISPSTLIRIKSPQLYRGVPPFQKLNGVMFTADYTVINGVVCNHTSPSHKNNEPWKFFLAHSDQYGTHRFIPYEDESAFILVLAPGEVVERISASDNSQGTVYLHVHTKRIKADGQSGREITFCCNPSEPSVIAA